MYCLSLLYVLFGISFSAGNPKAPNNLGEFLNNMTGRFEDQRVLSELFETNIVRPSDALLGILRSEKSSNGLFDCSGLVGICENFESFITSTTKMEDLECYFKYWVSHRDRNFQPSALCKFNRTLFFFIGETFAGRTDMANFNVVQALKLAKKHETRALAEDEMRDFFFGNGSNEKDKFLAGLLESGCPIYNSMLEYALYFAGRHVQTLAKHPRLLEYKPPGRTYSFWLTLALQLLNHERYHDAFTYSVESLRMGAEANFIYLDSFEPRNAENYHRHRRLWVLMFALASSYAKGPIRILKGRHPDIPLIREGCDLWLRFKLLLLILEQQEERSRSILEDVFFRNVGFHFD